MSVNGDLFVRGVAHQTGIIRYSRGVQSRMLKVLNDTEADLKRLIRERLSRIEERGFDTGPATTRRLNQLLALVVQANNSRYRSVSRELRRALTDAGEYEAEFNQRMIASTASVSVALPSAEVLASIVTSRPLRGQFVSDLIDELPARSSRRIHQQLRLGIAEGATTMQIVKNIFGTVDGTGGVMGISRRGLAGITHTMINHVMTHSRELLYMQNMDIVAFVRWLSTLDPHTTPYCQIRDQKLYKVGEGERPPGHWGCRSTTAPHLEGEGSLDGERASRFGSVPANTDYEAWLEMAKQDKFTLAAALKSKQRAKLFKDGGLSLDELIGPNDKFFTIAQLRNREAEAFARAGL